jgi:hypothetical protein
LKTNCKTCSILNSSKYGKKLKNHLKFREIIDSVIYIYIIYIKKKIGWKRYYWTMVEKTKEKGVGPGLEVK